MCFPQLTSVVNRPGLSEAVKTSILNYNSSTATSQPTPANLLIRNPQDTVIEVCEELYNIAARIPLHQVMRMNNSTHKVGMFFEEFYTYMYIFTVQSRKLCLCVSYNVCKHYQLLSSQQWNCTSCIFIMVYCFV